jgi:hypothetical protein
VFEEVFKVTNKKAAQTHVFSEVLINIISGLMTES